jgi:hypothetical protein
MSSTSLSFLSDGFPEDRNNFRIIPQSSESNKLHAPL